jgi:hypothetical protein
MPGNLPAIGSRWIRTYIDNYPDAIVPYPIYEICSFKQILHTGDQEIDFDITLQGIRTGERVHVSFLHFYKFYLPDTEEGRGLFALKMLKHAASFK